MKRRWLALGMCESAFRRLLAAMSFKDAPSPVSTPPSTELRGAFPVGTANYFHAVFAAIVNGILYVDPFTFDFKAQRYRDPSGVEASEVAFASMLNDSGQLAVIKDLDASGVLIAVNGEPINGVVHQLLFDSFCGNEEPAYPVGTTPSDWPQKTVAIKVCAAPEPEPEL